MGEAIRYPSDYEGSIGRDVVLAPPTCCSCSCCCCCCCTLAVPEAIVGSRWLARAEDAYDRAGYRPRFRDAYAGFAGGVLLANLLTSPIAGAIGFFALLATEGIAGIIILLALATMILVQSVRIGLKHGEGGATGVAQGLGAGILLCAVLATLIAAEVGIGIGFIVGDFTTLLWAIPLLGVHVAIIAWCRRHLKDAEALTARPRVEV